MSLAEELRLARAGTKALVAEDPVQITLRRQTYESDGMGGTKPTGPPVPFPPQTFRIVEGQSRGEQRVGVDGVQREIQFELIGDPETSANIQEGDTFSRLGTHYVIQYVNENQRWAVRAEVARYGRQPDSV